MLSVLLYMTSHPCCHPLQVADEHNLDVALGMASAPTGGPSKVKQPEEDLGARLAELRGK